MTPQDFVSSLHKLKDVSAQWKVLESWLHKGERQNLIEVAQLCAGAGQDEWQKHSMSDKIVVMLALERGWENITALMEIRRFAPPKVPYLAEILTQNQDWRELLRLFDSPSSRLQNREFLAFLAQEIVLRGPDLTQTSARLLLEDLVASGHELSVLPLFQLPCEAGFAAWRRRYNNRGGSSWSWKPRPGRRKVTISQEGQRLETREIECDAARIGSAVANWCEESNGKIEARCFAFAPLKAEEFGLQTLKNLGLESLRGADEMSLTRVDFSVALETLFAVACNGGAYNNGEYGARGRLRAWQSVAALCGSAAQNPIEIAEVARGCTWFEFSASNEWFYQVAWDLGVACLREERNSLAVLSATDTD